MDTYYTIDEKFLQAVEEYQYGETPKSLQLLNEIVAAEPLYARAYYQLGLIYYYQLKDYQQAGYCFKTCAELEPAFPDVYVHYLRLLSFLNMDKALDTASTKALQTPGVDHCNVYILLGKQAEKSRKLASARAYYEQAYSSATRKTSMEYIEQSIQRLDAKQQRSAAYRYSLVD
jgi:tetratricopeptide (TPR) repeat protein